MIGRTLAHYEILERIGSGGMGEVYRARDTKLDRDVALKILPESAAADPDRRTRFEREAKVVASLTHPNIVTVYSVDRAEGVSFITMELVEGQTLSALLPPSGFPPRRFFDLAVPLADAVRAAHAKGITHRDLKPDNVMVDPEGRVKVLDFGLARLLEPAPTGREGATVVIDHTPTQDGRILGTANYMSPEQAEGKPVDHRSDIFSLGIILFEMATGRRPFQGDSQLSVLTAILRDDPPRVTELNRQLPEVLGSLIDQCLAKDPGRRFQDAADVRNALDTLRGDSGSGSSPRVQAPAGRGIALPAVLGVYALVAAGVGGATWLLMNSLGLPGWVLPGALVLLALGFPILGFASRTRKREERGAWLTWRRAVTGGVVALAAWGLAIGGFMLARHLGIGPAASLVSAGVFAERDTVLIAEVENLASDPQLGGAIQEALSIDLAQSPAVTLMSSAGVAVALERMEKPPGTPLDVDLAREMAAREGAKAVVAARVTPAGSGYVLSARLLAPDGTALAAFRENASGSDELIDAIDRLSHRIREKVGESLKTIRSTPGLEQVTTESLAALQFYSQAVRVSDAGDEQRAVELLEQATQLDTTFAMAYRKMGVGLGNLGEDPTRQQDVLTRAFRHRDRLPERERQLTIASYYDNVTGDQAKVIAAYERLLELNPNDTWALNNLGLLYSGTENAAKGLELLEQAYRVDESPRHLVNIASAQIGLDRIPDALATLDTAETRYPEYRGLLNVRLLAQAADREYDGADSTARRLLDRAQGKRAKIAEAQDFMAQIAIIRGQLDRAGQNTAEATRAARDQGRPSWELGLQIQMAFAELMLAEDPARALDRVQRALDTVPLDSLPELERPHGNLIAFYVLANRLDEARVQLAGAEAQLPLQNSQARVWIHANRGMVLLGSGKPEAARAEFQQVDNGDVFTRTWQQFLMGLAYELGGEPDSAAVSYQRYLDVPMLGRLGADSPMYPFVLQHLAKLYDDMGDRERAIEYYRRFTDLWENADPELQPRVAAARRRIQELLQAG